MTGQNANDFAGTSCRHLVTSSQGVCRTCGMNTGIHAAARDVNQYHPSARNKTPTAQQTIQRTSSSATGKNQSHFCHTCHKSFKFESYLIRHLRSHSDAKHFVCNKCGIGFKHDFELIKHKRLCKADFMG